MAPLKLRQLVVADAHLGVTVIYNQGTPEHSATRRGSQDPIQACSHRFLVHGTICALQTCSVGSLDAVAHAGLHRFLG